MIQPQPQDWSAMRQEDDRSLSLPSIRTVLNTPNHQGSRLRLRELDAAASLQQIKSSSPRYAPPPPAEWVSVHQPPNDLHTRRLRPSTSSEWVMVKSSRHTQPCRLPSFGDAFGTAIAEADRLSLRSARSSIAESEWTLVGASSPASTATLYGSPAISPTTPCYNFAPAQQVYLPPAESRPVPYHDELTVRLKRKNLRRVTSRATIHGDTAHPHHHHQQQQQQSATRASTTSSSSSTKQPRRPASFPNLKGPKNARHFNQKYKNPDKLFIVYCKEDLKKPWPEIQELRLEMLHVLLGHDYDPEVEEAREISGLNGRFYRENDVMPLLTADGSGLVFREKDGRWWECVQSQKCRVAEGGEVALAAGGGGGAGRRKGSGGGTLDTRPRGMVERYPEEVLEYWDSHVRFFVPEERRADVFARATRYARVRREQRQHYGVPAWTLDNAHDRVLNLNPPKEADKTDGNTTALLRGRPAPRRRIKS